MATRTYTAGINQSSPGAHLLVVLESGEFLNNQNQFTGQMGGDGTAVSFTVTDLDAAPSACLLSCGVVEKVAANRVFQFFGTAQGTATGSGIAATL